MRQILRRFCRLALGQQLIKKTVCFVYENIYRRGAMASRETCEMCRQL